MSRVAQDFACSGGDRTPSQLSVVLVAAGTGDFLDRDPRNSSG
jgi:hypothetical protein